MMPAAESKYWTSVDQFTLPCLGDDDDVPQCETVSIFEGSDKSVNLEKIFMICLLSALRAASHRTLAASVNVNNIDKDHSYSYAVVTEENWMAWTALSLPMALNLIIAVGVVSTMHMSYVNNERGANWWRDNRLFMWRSGWDC